MATGFELHRERGAQTRLLVSPYRYTRCRIHPDLLITGVFITWTSMHVLFGEEPSE